MQTWGTKVRRYNWHSAGSLALPCRISGSTLTAGRAFSVAGPMAWNSLPDFIQDPTSSADCFRLQTVLGVYLKRTCSCVTSASCRAYFSVYYYTKCVLLKAGRATLKKKMCNIELATQTITHIIWCKTVADALKINVLNTKTSSALGGFAPPLTSTGGSAP